MSKLVNKIPDFLYKHAAINSNLLPEIRKECFKLFLQMFQKSPRGKMLYYFVDFKNDFGDIRELCPMLASELERLGILHLFRRMAFIQRHPEQLPMPIHRDYLPTADTDGYFALNIPVRGCEDSYTVFYKGEPDINAHWREDVLGTEIAKGAVTISDSFQPVEIDRVNSDTPLWINNYILHNGKSDSNKLRMLVSLRFYSMQHLFDSGYFDEHLVAK